MTQQRVRRVRRALAIAVGIVVTVSVTVWIQDRAPQVEDWQRPFLRSGHVGEPLRLRGGMVVEVGGVSGGCEIVVDDRRYPSAGVWLVVAVTLRTDRRPSPRLLVDLVDDRGRTFAQTDRFDASALLSSTQPGIAEHGAVAFEVPLDVGQRVRFRFAADNLLDGAFDEMADISVPIDADDWARWATDGTQVTPPPRTASVP